LTNARRCISAGEEGVRRAILDPHNDVVHRAYSHIREKLRTERGGQAISLVRYETGIDNIDDARYRLVL
jgi:hypothetical protein